MSCGCSSYSVVNGSVNQTEYTTKVYSLQCRYKDMVASLTNRWRYGIFCQEDNDKMVESRALLRLLIEYKVETNITEEALTLPQCYTDYIFYSGYDLTTLSFLPSPVGVDDYFYMRDEAFDQYWILKGASGLYTGQNPVNNYFILETLRTGSPFIQIGSGGGTEDYTMDVECSGVLSELRNAIRNDNGIEVTVSGLPSADIIKIVERLEKLLSC